MKRTSLVPPVYQPSLRVAVVTQLAGVVLSSFIDANGTFIAIAAAAWAVFWVGVVAMMRWRRHPSSTELAGLSYGPIAIPIAIFTVGQYF